MSEARDPRLIDVRHLGRAHVIGSWLVGDILVDPGPASALPALLEGLAGEVPRVIALTHIHLDHAGASGTLMARWPEAELWVHERGAPHMVDPAKLIASATRLYGAEMDRLWGEFLAVPADRMRVLSGGESLEGMEVAYTPGHASHHVSYFHPASGTAFTGDVAGVRVAADGPVLAPTPPPDIDLEAWRRSLETLEEWSPRALAPTHFGIYRDVPEHLAELRACLAEFERRARELTREEFIAAMRADASARIAAGEQGAYGQAMPPDQTYAGLERYLVKSGAMIRP